MRKKIPSSINAVFFFSFFFSFIFLHCIQFEKFEKFETQETQEKQKNDLNANFNLKEKNKSKKFLKFLKQEEREALKERKQEQEKEIFIKYSPLSSLGKEIFIKNCMVCHIGGKNLIIPEKNLKKETLEANGMNTVRAISYQILNGKNGMPAFGGRLTEDEIKDVASYVIEKSIHNFETEL